MNLNVSVAYHEDLDRVREVIDAVGAELATDAEWGEKILESPAVLRVNAFEDSGVQLKILGTAADDAVGGDRGTAPAVKQAFDREGIEIPFPHRVLPVREEKPDSAAAARSPGRRYRPG